MASRSRKTELNALKAELEAATPPAARPRTRRPAPAGAPLPEEEVARVVEEAAEEASVAVEKAKASAAGTLDDVVAQAHGLIRAHPLRALGIAFAVGLVLGRKRRR